MDTASALLGALRVKAMRGGTSRIEAHAVEELAGLMGLVREDVPPLVDRLQRDGHVALVWGGALDVLAKAPASEGESGGVHIYGGNFGPGTTIGGRDPTGGTVNFTPENAVGALVDVLERLRRMRPDLTGEAAMAADEADRALSEAVKPQATDEARRSWTGTARAALGRLFDAAPKAKALLDIGEKALGAIT